MKTSSDRPEKVHSLPSRNIVPNGGIINGTITEARTAQASAKNEPHVHLSPE